MEKKIRELFPEIEWIKDPELQAKVVASYVDALKTGGWEPEDMDKIPFTLLIPNCPFSYLEHVRGVTRVAKRAMDEFNAIYAAKDAKFTIDNDLLVAGALLHDVARTEPQHAQRGAEYLTELGYPRVADIVRQHHGLDAPGELNEAAVVFLADKLVQGERFVGVEARFAASEARCLTPEAKAAHAAQLAQARQVEKLIRQAAPRARIEPTAF